MIKNKVVIYGSYGYTGKLIVAEAKSKRLPVVLAGRNKSALKQQSDETGFPFDVVDIQNSASLENLLLSAIVVIHCAGPFQYTAQRMIEACLKTKTHYTDITGEYQVFELLAQYDLQAKQSGIMVMPGVGFDVVPSDCLAVHLKSRLPSATHLQLAFAMSKGGLSRGTTKTMIEGLGEGSKIRYEGKLKTIPLGDRTLEIDFNGNRTPTLCIPWGDIATAWRSTGIPNIEVYSAATPTMISNAKRSRYLNWLLRKRWLKNFLLKKVDQRAAGPSDERRSAGRSYLWGKVWNAKNESRVSTLETVSGYSLTAITAVLISQKIINGHITVGYQTPAMAYGADLILEVQETQRKDVS